MFIALTKTYIDYMVFEAKVIRAMIASPSDVPDARDAVEKALHDWNQANAHRRGIVFMPWRWETSAVPLMGGSAQAVINAQGLDQADIVFALFGAKLGTQTATAVSGTAEELLRAHTQGKPVHVYFSNTALDLSGIDPEALSSLREFKSRLQGLYREFTNENDLLVEVWRAAEHDIGALDLAGSATSSVAPAPTGVRWSVDHETQREVSKIDNRGNPKYTTRHHVVVTNQGDQTATGVVFSAVPEGSRMHLAAPEHPTDVYPGQSKRLAAMFMMGGAEPQLRITWAEDDANRTQDFYVN